MASVLEHLELEQPTVVTIEMLDQLADAREMGTTGARLARDLRERGWLLPLRTTGAWEFAPAARAGAIGAGDPLVELRATLRRKNLPFAVAAESAAWLHRLSGRPPTRAVIGAPPGTRLPEALADYRLVRWRPATPLDTIGELPVWSRPTLLAAMAASPSTYRDWPSVGEWLAEAVDEHTWQAIAAELAEAPRSAWARASYLLKFAGYQGAAETLFTRAPTLDHAGPYHLGRRDRPGRYDKQFGVHDHLLAPNPTTKGRV